MNKRPCLLITADMYTPVLLLTSCQQDGPSVKAGQNVAQSFKQGTKKIEKTGDAIKDKVEKVASSLDDATVTMVI